MSNDFVIGSRAVLVDKESRFVTFMGEVIEAGDVLILRNVYDTEKYNKRALLETIDSYGLSLIFLPANLKLPMAPSRILDQFYKALPQAKLSLA
jgi:hypothetical protein